MTNRDIAQKCVAPQSGVYTITCTENGKVYCGSSGQIETRLYFHFWQLNKMVHPNQELQKDYDRYGKLAFETAVAAIEPNRHKRNKMEYQLIAEMKGLGTSYNMQYFQEHPISRKTLTLQKRKEFSEVNPKYNSAKYLM